MTRGVPKWISRIAHVEPPANEAAVGTITGWYDPDAAAFDEQHDRATAELAQWRADEPPDSQQPWVDWT